MIDKVSQEEKSSGRKKERGDDEREKSLREARVEKGYPGT
jgi:hypothetical protein